MGAGKWREEYCELLKDRKVAIIPDNDLAGQRHVEYIARKLIDVAVEVKIIDLPDLPDNGSIFMLLGQSVQMGSSMTLTLMLSVP